jgi:hypothetical protein
VTDLQQVALLETDRAALLKVLRAFDWGQAKVYDEWRTFSDRIGGLLRTSLEALEAISDDDEFWQSVAQLPQALAGHERPVDDGQRAYETVGTRLAALFVAVGLTPEAARVQSDAMLLMGLQHKRDPHGADLLANASQIATEGRSELRAHIISTRSVISSGSPAELLRAADATIEWHDVLIRTAVGMLATSLLAPLIGAAASPTVVAVLKCLAGKLRSWRQARKIREIRETSSASWPESTATEIALLRIEVASATSSGAVEEIDRCDVQTVVAEVKRILVTERSHLDAGAAELQREWQIDGAAYRQALKRLTDATTALETHIDNAGGSLETSVDEFAAALENLATVGSGPRKQEGRGRES